MKLQIDRPQWLTEEGYAKDPGEHEEWFQEHVEPINKLLAAGVEVYTSRDMDEITLIKMDEKEHAAISSNFRSSTHTALLINIQPIECSHSPAPHFGDGGWEVAPGEIYECTHCGKKLKAKWEVAE